MHVNIKAKPKSRDFLSQSRTTGLDFLGREEASKPTFQAKKTCKIKGDRGRFRPLNSSAIVKKIPLPPFTFNGEAGARKKEYTT